MGAEFSCAHPRKSLEDSLEAVCDGVEAVADTVEQAFDDVTKPSPARPFCKLSDADVLAAQKWFHELLQLQGRVFERGAPVVYEDATLAGFLERMGLLSLQPPAADKREEAGSADALEEAMKEKLHSIPIGHWLMADPGRKGYTLDEWSALVGRLLGPSLIADEQTIPFDDPLPVSTLLPLAEEGALVCGCSNHSTLDQMEHMMDAQGAAVASSSACRGTAAMGDGRARIRPTTRARKERSNPECGCNACAAASCRPRLQVQCLR
jgi:hypothetical protein